MILAGTLFTVVIVAIATMCLVPRLARKSVFYDLVPDTPRAFGYKMSWIAILTTDTEVVLDALGIAGETASNWDNGIGTVYDPLLGPDRIFVSPPVDGWTFVVGIGLPHPVGRGYADKCTPLMARLAQAFVDVQYYFSYPSLNQYSWVRFREGRLVRAFATTNDGVVWSKGQISRAEQSLGLKLFQFRGVKARHGDLGGEILMTPTEDQVMQIARSWSGTRRRFVHRMPPRRWATSFRCRRPGGPNGSRGRPPELRLSPGRPLPFPHPGCCVTRGEAALEQFHRKSQVHGSSRTRHMPAVQYGQAALVPMMAAI